MTLKSEDDAKIMPGVLSLNLNEYASTSAKQSLPSNPARAAATETSTNTMSSPAMLPPIAVDTAKMEEETAETTKATATKDER
jgi:hypothetical protein